MKKICVLVLLAVFAALLFSGCGNTGAYNNGEAPSAEAALPETTGESDISVPAEIIDNSDEGQTEGIDETEEDDETDEVDEIESNDSIPVETAPVAYYMELFMPIIDALARLEQNGHVISGEDFIRASLSAIQLDWGSEKTIADSLFDIQRWVSSNFGCGELPQLVYTLHDISQTGRTPSLFVGVKSNGFIELAAIYVLETSTPDPAAEPERGVRFVFSSQGNDKTTLTTAIEGHSVITSTWRDSSGRTMEYFQIFGPGIGVGWLDFIATAYPQQRYRVCYIGPCEHCDDGFTRITEDEYLEVIHRFGTSGYDVEADIEARYVTLDWRPVLTDSPQTYTIEQIQAALQQSGQFMVGDWGEGDPQVISVQRVERVRDYFFWDSAQMYVDLTNTYRYRVEARFRQPLEDYLWWSELFQGADFFRRDGDYTILTDYYYFIDVDGEPESAFVLC